MYKNMNLLILFLNLFIDINIGNNEVFYNKAVARYLIHRQTKRS